MSAIRVKLLWAFPFWIPVAEIFILLPMFDIVKPQITTAADKITHLRRFL